MYDDLSDTETSELRYRKRLTYVVSSQHVGSEEDIGRNEQAMESCIELFRMLYADDMEDRCGFTEDNEKGEPEPANKLPIDLAIAVLLNPMYGGKFFFCCSAFLPHPLP